MANLKAIRELTRMRVLLFLREPEAVFWVFMFPVILAVVLGWAFQDTGLATEDVAIVVKSTSESDPGMQLAERLKAEPHLDVEIYRERATAERELRLGRVAVLLLPGDRLADPAPPGSGGNSAQPPGPAPTIKYDPERPEGDLARLRIERALIATAGLENLPKLRVETVEETGSRYVDWLFPGLLGMNIMSTGIWSIGFGLTELRQKKLLRRFMITPMNRSSFLLSFILARFVFLVLEVTVLVLFAVLALGIPFEGTVAGFVTLVLLSGLAFSGLGILAASRVRTIEGVSGVINFIMMPMWLFSGVFFSYDRFPEATHAFIRLIPLTALNDALRGLTLEGATLSRHIFELGVLGAWGIVTFLLALWLFRWE